MREPTAETRVDQSPRRAAPPRWAHGWASPAWGRRRRERGREIVGRTTWWLDPSIRLLAR